MNFALSVIIPALNEADSLGQTIEAVKSLDKNIEIIVVDGGSSDETIPIAEKSGATVLKSERGRGTQMHAGAKAANGDVLWFIHADSLPAPETVEQITKALEYSAAVGGNFRIRFDGETGAAKFMTRLYPKLRKIKLVYGDSGIFVRREIYRKIGGFKSLPLFEDLDFVNRLQREGDFLNFPAAMTTSSRRFEGRSFALMFSRWSFLQVLYWLGISPHRLIKLYLPVRERGKRKIRRVSNE